MYASISIHIYGSIKQNFSFRVTCVVYNVYLHIYMKNSWDFYQLNKAVKTINLNKLCCMCCIISIKVYTKCMLYVDINCYMAQDKGTI